MPLSQNRIKKYEEYLEKRKKYSNLKKLYRNSKGVPNEQNSKSINNLTEELRQSQFVTPKKTSVTKSVNSSINETSSKLEPSPDEESSIPSAEVTPSLKAPLLPEGSQTKSTVRGFFKGVTQFLPYARGLTRSLYAASNAFKTQREINKAKQKLKEGSYLGEKSLSKANIKQKFENLVKLEKQRKNSITTSADQFFSAAYGDLPAAVIKLKKLYNHKTRRKQEQQEPQEQQEKQEPQEQKEQELSLYNQARLEKLLHGYTKEYGRLRNEATAKTKNNPLYQFAQVYPLTMLPFAVKNLLEEIKKRKRGKKIRKQTEQTFLESMKKGSTSENLKPSPINSGYVDVQ
jgi:hypothetical protein